MDPGVDRAVTNRPDAGRRELLAGDGARQRALRHQPSATIHAAAGGEMKTQDRCAQRQKTAALKDRRPLRSKTEDRCAPRQEQSPWAAHGTS